MQMNTRYLWRSFGPTFLFFLIAGQVWGDEASLRVLTTIKPLQLIAVAVFGETAKIDVLLDPRMSPHDYQLRPSDRSKLERADVVFWIGPAMETFLAPVLASLPQSTKVIPLQAEIAAVGDSHLWMDPLLAAAIGHKMADVLGELAPAYSPLWHANAERLEKALVAEDRQLREQFIGIKSPHGYLVAHDAYSRFEARYGLSHRAALTDNADLPPSAQHIMRIQALLDAGEISCVMQESLAQPKVLQTLISGRKLSIQKIDALALAVPLNGGGIVQFYRALGASMSSCLQPNAG